MNSSDSTDLHGHGLPPNHPLYKDYRAAISSRDDPKALELIREIARLHPGDENATRELKRLRHKSVLSLLSILRDTLEADDTQALLTTMAEVEQTGLPEDYAASPDWQKASSLRARHQREEARRSMPSLLDQAEKSLASGDLQTAITHHRKFLALVADHGQPPESDHFRQRATHLETGMGEARAAAEKQVQRLQSLAELTACADEIDTQLASPAGISPEAAATLLEKWLRQQKQFTAAHGKIPPDAAPQIENARIRLTAILDDAHHGKRRNFLLITAAVVIALSLAALGTFGIFRAKQYADQLATLRAKPSASGAREVLHGVERSEPWLLRFPQLTAEAAQTRQWLESIESHSSLARRELTALESLRQTNFQETPPPELLGKLQEIDALITSLPPDLAAEPASRLSLLQHDAERFFTRNQQENHLAARDAATRWNSVMDEIDLSGPASATRAALKNAPAELEPFLQFAGYDSPWLRLPDESETLIRESVSRLRSLASRAESTISALKSLDGQITLDSYRDGLATLADCGFQEGFAARRVLDVWPDDDTLRATLAFRGDLAALRAAANDGMSGTPVPPTVTDGDRDVITALVTSEVLNSLWEVDWKNAKGTQRKQLSLGPLNRLRENEWKGKMAGFPKLASAPVEFRDIYLRYYEGNSLISNHPTATTAMMSQLGLRKLLDNGGTRFQSSVLTLLDTVANDPQTKPLAKAYVFGQLVRIIRNHRPEEWGLYYCPAMADAIRDFEALALRAPILEAAWLLEQAPETHRVWEEFFAPGSKRIDFSTLRTTRAAAREVQHATPTMAGRITADGTISPAPSPDSRIILALHPTENGQLRLNVCGVIDLHGNGLPADTHPAPFSPLWTLPLSPETRSFLLTLLSEEK